MSRPAPYTLYPERCDQCGRCLRACPEGGLKVGAAFIAIDREVCTSCDACVDACDRDAILPRVAPARVAAQPASVAGVAKVEVGSRAEAKTLLKAAKAAEKAASKAASGATAATGGAKRMGGVATWTAIDVMAVLVIMAVALLAKNAILGLEAVALMPAAARSITRAVVLAAYYGAQLAGMAFIAHRHGSGLFEAFGLRGDEASDAGDGRTIAGSVGWVLVLFLGTELVSIGYGLAMQAWGWEQPARLSSDVTAVFGGGGMGLVLSAVLVAIAAPLVEEMAFRGIVLPVWSRSLGEWGGILTSAGLYAAFHFSLWMFLPTFVLGIALGWLVRSRGGLVPALALHVLYNAAAVAAAFAVAG